MLIDFRLRESIDGLFDHAREVRSKLNLSAGAAAHCLLFRIPKAREDIAVAVELRKRISLLGFSNRRNGDFIGQIKFDGTTSPSEQPLASILLRVFRLDAQHCRKR